MYEYLKKILIFVEKTMNHKMLLLLLTLQLSTLGNSQTLSNSVRQDFCKNAVLNYEYGTNMFRAWMIQSARSLGIIDPYEINKAVQNIAKNQKLQEEFFKNINRLGGDKSFRIQQFVSIGMTFQNSIILVDYIYLKYNSNVIKEVEISNKGRYVKKDRDNHLVNEIVETTRCKVLKRETWIYTKNSFKSNDESQKSRVQKLIKGTLLNVIVDWEEEPNEMVKIIYKDIKGKEQTGYVITSSLEFLDAG
jgi:hypothetical protein